MKKEIKIFDLKFESDYVRKFLNGSKKILSEGFLGNHTFVRKLEEKVKNRNKSKYAIGVHTGTGAIELILRSLNINGKKVLIASNTFIATAKAVISAGGKPEPVDIENKYFSLCPKKLKQKINPKIGAVIIVHIGGLVTPNIFLIKKICNTHKIPLVEDCAQAFNSSLNNIKVGNFGIAGAFSLQTTKVLTAGEGGIVVTNNKKFYNKLIRNRQYGYSKNNKLDHNLNGSNFKMSEFVALAAICDLDRFNKRSRKRIQIAKRYQENLKNTNWNTLKPVINSKTSYYKQIIISPINRNKVKKVFQKKKISLTGGVYYFPLHRQTFLGKKDDKKYINSSFFADRHFCPPCYPELNLSDIDYICNVLKNIKI